MIIRTGAVRASTWRANSGGMSKIVGMDILQPRGGIGGEAPSPWPEEDEVAIYEVPETFPGSLSMNEQGI